MQYLKRLVCVGLLGVVVRRVHLLLLILAVRVPPLHGTVSVGQEDNAESASRTMLLAGDGAGVAARFSVDESGVCRKATSPNARCQFNDSVQQLLPLTCRLTVCMSPTMTGGEETDCCGSYAPLP